MPGESARINGKLGGRPRLEATKLREAIIRKAEERAEELAQAIVDKALDGKALGDVPALKEVFDRGIGKVIQGLDHTSGGERIKGFNLIPADETDNTDDKTNS